MLLDETREQRDHDNVIINWGINNPLSPWCHTWGINSPSVTLMSCSRYQPQYHLEVILHVFIKWYIGISALAFPCKLACKWAHWRSVETDTEWGDDMDIDTDLDWLTFYVGSLTLNVGWQMVRALKKQMGTTWIGY